MGPFGNTTTEYLSIGYYMRGFCFASYARRGRVVFKSSSPLDCVFDNYDDN